MWTLNCGSATSGIDEMPGHAEPAWNSDLTPEIGSLPMDMLKGDQIAEANLTDWRKLAQGLHARYLVHDFGTGARFVAAVGEAGDALGHHPSVSIGKGYVDLKLVSADAIYRDSEGTEHVVEWVTQQDVDLARLITEIAADHKVGADPASVSMIELGLDTARSATIAPVWAALLTGNADAQGHGSLSDEVRDATGRVPNLWFGDADEGDTPRQRFHVEVYVAPEVAEQRIAAALAAGGAIVDDSNAPGLTVLADQDGNEGIICIDVSAAKKK
jgi:4a-hydroxytetrahydrobiopterin dehydratase